MTEARILTPEQIEGTCNAVWPGRAVSHALVAAIKGLAASHEELREELRLGNVLCAKLTDRVSDLETALAEAQVAIQKLIPFLQYSLDTSCNCVVCLSSKRLLALPAVERGLEKLKGEEMTAPRSPADPRPGGVPFYLAKECIHCGSPLILDPSHGGYLDEFICPKCNDGVYLDTPPAHTALNREAQDA